MAFFGGIEHGDELSIDIKCSPLQRNIIDNNLDHVEVWPDDPNRVRLIYKDGRKGPWFSRNWRTLNYGTVAPK